MLPPLILSCEPPRAVIGRAALLGAAASTRYMSLTLVPAGGAGAWVLYVAAVFLFTLSVTPSAFWDAMANAVITLGNWAMTVASTVWIVLEWLWPRIRDFMKAVLQLPLLVGCAARAHMRA